MSVCGKGLNNVFVFFNKSFIIIVHAPVEPPTVYMQ